MDGCREMRGPVKMMDGKKLERWVTQLKKMDGFKLESSPYSSNPDNFKNKQTDNVCNTAISP